MASVTVQHLNADTTWLINFKQDHNKSPWTLLIDPWLVGYQVDYAPIFSKQAHGQEQPCVQSLEDIPFSAIYISHEFSDHLHCETLSQIKQPERCIIFATRWAAVKLRKWNRGFQVVEIPSFAKGESTPTVNLRQLVRKTISDEFASLVPDDIGVVYLPTTSKTDLAGAKLHGLSIFSFNNNQDFFAYGPHGVHIEAAQIWKATIDKSAKFHALMLGLDGVDNPWWLGGKIVLGWPVAIELATLFRPTLLISTHDEDDKPASGLVAKVMTRTKAPSIEEIQAILKENGLETRAGVVKNGDTRTIA